MYNKYKVSPKDKRTGPDGFVYDSKGEMNRYFFLEKKKLQGEIVSEIHRQVTYPLHVNGHLVCKYVADFVYSLKGGKEVIEDYKGVMTPVASLKSKLFFACLGEKISIVKKPNEWHTET